jgi:hypothetical protein
VTRLGVLALMLAVAAPRIVLAGDSSWLVCKGIGERGAKADRHKRHVLVSAFEHRGSADTRDLSVTLVWADHVSRGTAKNVTTKPLALTTRTVEGKRSVMFAGKVTVAKDLSAITLNGVLDGVGDGKRLAFDAQLSCEILDDASIDHQ